MTSNVALGRGKILARLHESPKEERESRKVRLGGVLSVNHGLQTKTRRARPKNLKSESLKQIIVKVSWVKEGVTETMANPPRKS